MKRLQAVSKAALLSLGIMLMTLYLIYRAEIINFSPTVVILSLILFLAELHSILQFYGMAYSLWPRKYKHINAKNPVQDLAINIFICVCGEDLEIIRDTVLAAKQSVQNYTAIRNHIVKPQIIVLNDGFVAKKENWPEVEILCKELRVDHVRRTISGGYKAGNINNGLKVYPANNPDKTIDIILDADYVVNENFLTEIIKPFNDTSIDFVQTPQSYRNMDTWVAEASSDHQDFFFQKLCPAKAYDNALFLCGTNFAVRRSALNAVNGLDTRFIAEDFATSIKMHAIGKKGVYIPKVLATGIGPSTLSAYYTQQRRWAKGTLDASIANIGELWRNNLSIKQKIHYSLAGTFYLIGIRTLLMLFAPIFYLIFHTGLVTNTSTSFFVLIYFPFLLYNYITFFLLFKHPIKSLILQMVTFPIYTDAFFSSILRKTLGFMVTSKKQDQNRFISVYWMQLIILFTLGLIWFYASEFLHHTTSADSVNYTWLFYSMIILCAGGYYIGKEYVKTFIKKYSLPLSDLYTKHPFSFAIRPAVPAFVTVMLLLLMVRFTGITSAIYQTSYQVIASMNSTKKLAIPTNGIYYGYYMQDLNAHPLNAQITPNANEQPSLAMYYQDWGYGTEFDTAFMEQLSQKNVIPIITWEPWNIKTDTKQKGSYALKDIIDGKYDDYIHEWARAAAAYRQPFFLRFAHEMNGYWYPWSAVGSNTTEEYIAMWRHVHDIFVEEHATNVIWVYSPNNDDGHGSAASILDYYPGDAYVDWVGFSGFNWGTSENLTKWKSFQQVAEDAYDYLSIIHKPMMVAETSSVSSGGNKADWFDNLFTTDLKAFPRIKAIILYNDNYGNADFSLSSGMNATQVIQKDIVNNSYFIKQPQLLPEN